MNTLESQVRMMNREVLALKTAQPLGSSMRTYYGKYKISTIGDGKRHYYEITYAPSSQPIMTEVYNNTNMGFVLFSPVGDTQRMCDLRPDVAEIETEREVLIMSSRQILGIRRINDPN